MRNRLGVIRTSKKLIEELLHFDNTFITVMVDEKEYVIDSIGHSKKYGIDGEESHLCLNVRNGGSGFILR